MLVLHCVSTHSRSYSFCVSAVVHVCVHVRVHVRVRVRECARACASLCGACFVWSSVRGARVCVYLFVDNCIVRHVKTSYTETHDNRESR